MTLDTAVLWLVFTASLPGRSQSTPRVRLWRALKDCGAVTLRDGVALLPARADHRRRLEDIGRQVRRDGGTAWLLELPAQRPEMEAQLRAGFDRAEAYRAIQTELAALVAELPQLNEAGARQRLRRIERELDAVVTIDFFPQATQTGTRQALAEVADRINRRYSPREPSAVAAAIPRLDPAPYRNRRWATRRHLWVDRVASAWLIRRYIDPAAQFLWLQRPEDCPPDALGFDFDGAAFSHVGERVTFEVLQTSFGLESDPALTRLGRLVHHLDVGGENVAEASGFEAVLAGLRDAAADDDALLAAATPVLDALHRHYALNTP